MKFLIPEHGGRHCHSRRPQNTSCIRMHMHKGEALTKFYVLELGTLRLIVSRGALGAARRGSHLAQDLCQATARLTDPPKPWRGTAGGLARQNWLWHGAEPIPMAAHVSHLCSEIPPLPPPVLPRSAPHSEHIHQLLGPALLQQKKSINVFWTPSRTRLFQKNTCERESIIHPITKIHFLSYSVQLLTT